MCYSSVLCIYNASISAFHADPWIVVEEMIPRSSVEIPQYLYALKVEYIQKDTS